MIPNKLTDRLRLLSTNVVLANFIILSISEILGRAFTAVATIYLARTLGVTSYGILGFAATLVLYFSAIVDWGIEMFGPSKVAEDQDQVVQNLFSLIIARLVASGVLILGLILFGYIFLTRVEANVLAIYSFFLITVAINIRWVHLGLEKTRVIAIVRLLSELVKVLIIFVFVKGPEDVYKAPFSMVIGELIGAALLIAWIFREGYKLKYSLHWPIIRLTYSRALPLMVTILIGLWIDNADVLYIRSFRSISEVGIYLSAYTLLNFLGIIGNTTRMSLIPALTRLRKIGEQQVNLYQTSMSRLFAIGLPMAVGVFLISPQLIQLVFGSEYQAASLILKILIWSFPIMLLRTVSAAVLVANGQQKYVLRMTGIALVFSIILNVILTPILGMIGTAITTLLTEVVRFSIGQRFIVLNGLPLAELRNYWRSISSAIIMAALLWLVRLWPIWIIILVGASGYLLGLLITGGIRLRRGQLPIIGI